MLDRRYVLDHLDEVKRKTAARGDDFDFDRLVALATERKDAQARFESLRAEQKSASGGMRELQPGSDEFHALRAKLKEMSDEAKRLEERAKEVDGELTDLLLTLPNAIDDDAPIGTSEDDNVFVRESGAPGTYAFDVRDHVDIGEALGVLDGDAAARVAGARFTFLRGGAARLERALINFMLDVHTGEHGYEEMMPPLLVNADAATGTGQLPKFGADMFATPRPGAADESFYLIPTAEVPVTNYLRDQLLESYPGTLKFAAWTPCFRSEAGSHGRDTRGLIRQHQFNKVELVKFTTAEESAAEHLALLDDACSILDRLELPYRVMDLCSADIGFSAARCFDVEVWLPSQGTYREISSCSNFRDYQARRAGLRYRGEDGKPRFFHTINGSGLAVGRTLVALLENFQEADGTVTIPDALRPYTGFERLSAVDFMRAARPSS